MKRNLTVKRLVKIMRHLDQNPTEQEVIDHLKRIKKKPCELTRIEVIHMAGDLWEASQRQGKPKPQFKINPEQTFSSTANQLFEMVDQLFGKTA
jgi:hypothetical protein